MDREGRAVWEWHSHEHLDPQVERICPLEGRREWTHCNSVEELPDGKLLVSFRQTSTVGIIDRVTGKMTWRLKAGTTSHQHAPTQLPGGNVLIFDNGEHRFGGGTFSRVIEVVPSDWSLAWEYRASPRDSFFSTGISNAQRLPNGDTLICEGRGGRIFEVTPEGSIVWDYLNPHQSAHRDEPRQQAIYRAYRYAADSPQIRNRV